MLVSDRSTGSRVAQGRSQECRCAGRADGGSSHRWCRSRASGEGAATTDLVTLAMANWSSTRTPRISSALPVAPLQVPSADITVAAIPPPPAISLRAAWNLAASSAETGSSLMSANSAVGRVSLWSLGEGDAVVRVVVGLSESPEPHPARSTTRPKATSHPWRCLTFASSRRSVR